jgi:hypothetical protein
LTFDRRQKVLSVLKKAFPEYPCFMGFDYVPELRACVENKVPFVYADHAYFNRGYEAGNFRVVLSDIHQTKLKDYSKPRFRVEGMEWRKGDNIVVFPPSATIAQTFVDARTWLQETVDAIRKHTDRPIIIKKKQDGELRNYLANAHAAVGYATVASVEAALHGVPVFCGPHCPATPVGLSDLSRIEEPITPDRAPWVSTLTHSQFHLSEIANGFCREILLGQ